MSWPSRCGILDHAPGEKPERQSRAPLASAPMTSPPEDIIVECPDCGLVYEDWYRPSLNLDLDDFDEEYVREASTATCPSCHRLVEIGTLIVQDDIWRSGGT